MLQGWHDLASLHWRYDPALVQAWLPPAFRVDTFDGSAWVGILPFQMHRIRLPHLPALGPWSSFPETNVRTYIVDSHGRRGVWFASLDITRVVPAALARISYHLPYCWATMDIERHGDHITYRSRRRWPAGSAELEVGLRIGPALAPDDISELEHFLSARWALGSTWAGRPTWAEVDHGAWPLHRGEVTQLDQTLLRAAGLADPVGAPVVLWSPGVEVRIGRPHWLR
jgi:hypothetical protein